ncbi:hypothetical protein Chor_010543 [Crotalus horridus]
MSAAAPAEVEESVARRYEIKRRLGKGAYGIVWKATERRTGASVAVKKIFDAFRNRTDAQLLNVIRAQNDKDVYLVFESMETDLHAVIKKGNLLKDIHKCYILYQLLKATKYIHSGNVIHRDQKPSNVLLDRDCFVKLCDFGLARSLGQIEKEEGNPALTEYVATRWYRAPEILLASKWNNLVASLVQNIQLERNLWIHVSHLKKLPKNGHSFPVSCERVSFKAPATSSYTKGVDMWSIGCILGEMLLGKPLLALGSGPPYKMSTFVLNQASERRPRLPGMAHRDTLPLPFLAVVGVGLLDGLGADPHLSVEGYRSIGKELGCHRSPKLPSQRPGPAGKNRKGSPRWSLRGSSDPLLCFADIEAFHSDYQASVIKRVSCQPQLTLEELLPASTPPQALDLLKRLLVFNPKKRLTAEEALEHPYVQRFHCAAKEPALNHSVTLPLADDVQLSVAEYRNRVYELILEWKASSQAQKQQPLHRDHLPSGSSEANFLPAGNVATGPPPSGLRQHRRAAGTSALWDVPKGPGAAGQATSPFKPLSLLSQAQEAALHQHLMRKGAVPSRAAAGLNPQNPESHGREEAHFFLKPCRKMFQVTANVGIAGDPKAHLGSYSQTGPNLIHGQKFGKWGAEKVAHPPNHTLLPPSFLALRLALRSQGLQTSIGDFS